jgi:hypothetical protein
MDMTRIVLESLWNDMRLFGPFWLLTFFVAGVMTAVAAVRNEPTFWRDLPGGLLWGWLAGMTVAIVFSIASVYIEESIRKAYDYKNWQVLQVFALVIFGPICLVVCYWTTGWWFRRKIKQRRLRHEQGLPILPHAWYAISLRTFLLIQLGVFLTIGGWYSANRNSLESRYHWKQRRAWHETVHARFDRYGWNLGNCWEPLQLKCSAPLVGFDDQVLEKLLPTDELRTLHIHSDQLTIVGMRTISEQATLEYLTITSQKIKNADLVPLAKLPRLRRLILDCPNLTEAALDELQKCPALEDISIRRPEISREALAAFRAAKPKVFITANHPWIPVKRAVPQTEAAKK